MQMLGRKLIDVIEENQSLINILVSNNLASQIIIRDYHIFKKYLEYEHEPSKMQRYANVAEDLGIDEQTVRKTIYKLECLV